MVSIKQSIIRRLLVVFGFLFMLAIAVIGRMVYILHAQGDLWRGEIYKKTIHERTIAANRGNILSDNGSLLATSLPEYIVGFDPNVANNSKRNQKLYKTKIDSLCNALPLIFKEKSATYFKNKIIEARANKKDYIILGLRNITYEEKIRLEHFPLAKEGKYKSGITFEKLYKRVHPFDNMGLRTIGYLLDKEGKGVGLEKSMDAYLAGRPGKGLFEKLKGNSWKPIEDSPETKPIPGSDVYTTLNVNIQDETETALRKAVEQYQPNYASAIVMEVKTGEIKAMANLSFSKKENNYTENYNYAVAGGTTPGSTFKLPAMLALLEEGLNPNDSVDTGNGRYMFNGKWLSDSRIGGFGKLSVQEVFEKSSNIGIVKLVMKTFGNDKQKFYDYLKKYRLDQKLGFQITGEPAPLFYMPGHKRHSDFSMPWTAFGGYESALTPLQMLTFYNAIANDGYWVQPIIVKYIKNIDQTAIDFTESQRRSDEPIVSQKTLVKIKSMLEGVVERGTAAKQKCEIYRFAGKTGTSKKIINGAFSEHTYYTAFAGYFPAENPRYSCIIVIDEPKKMSETESVYAADVCAPVFRQIADHIYADDLTLDRKSKTKASSIKNLNAPQKALNDDYEAISMGFNNKLKNLKSAKINVNLDINSEKNTIPSVVGLPLRDALFVLENKNFRVKYKGIGKVKSQSIPAGTLAESGRVIELQLL